MNKAKATITHSKLRRLSFTNSPDMPQAVSIDGRRKEWVGIYWIDCGALRGDEAKRGLNTAIGCMKEAMALNRPLNKWHEEVPGADHRGPAGPGWLRETSEEDHNG